MSKRVLVTGASGHVGKVLIQDLIANGYTVRASVRDPNDRAKTKGLDDLGVEIVRADLFDEGSLKAACQGMDGLFQVAGVYDFNPSNRADAEKMIQAGVTGAKNALNAASDAGVGRVVLTSSVVTIGPIAHDAGAATEESWVSDLSIPYIEEKTRGEQTAWALAREKGLNMVSVLPAGILGPGFERPTASTDFVEAVAKGSVRFGVPQVDFPAVDVRDVAVAHRLAYEKGVSGERYIAMMDAVSIYDVALAIYKAMPQAKPPLMKVPKNLTGMVPMFDYLMSKIRNYPHTYTRTMHQSWGHREWRIDDSQSRAALGFTPTIGLDETVADTLKQLKKIGRL